MNKYSIIIARVQAGVHIFKRENIFKYISKKFVTNSNLQYESRTLGYRPVEGILVHVQQTINAPLPGHLKSANIFKKTFFPTPSQLRLYPTCTIS